MSVKVMAQVWDLDNDKIDREEKYILLAYADHADHDGNNMFPSIETICKKTGYKERSVQMITRSLESKGYLIPSGHGKNGTNKWSFGWGAENAGVQNTTLRGAERKGKGVQQDAPEPLTIIKPSHDLTEEEKEQVNNGLTSYLALSQAPGIKREARINDILSYLGVTFRRNTSTKEWLTFAKYIDSEFQSKGWDVKQFVSWLFGQKDYNPNYWPVKKMMEFYPSAFAEKPTVSSMFETLS